MPRVVLVAVTLVSLALPVSARSIATTFGSDLSRPADLNIGCDTTAQLSLQQIGEYELVPSGAASCTWRQLGVFGVIPDAHASTVPADGVITSVSIRSGANPAPLRAVVVRLLAPDENGGINTNKAVCCYFVRESPILRPVPNAVSTFALDLPVERNNTGGQVYTQDQVGISAQAGTGTLPLADVGPHSSERFTQSGSFDANFAYPAMGALPNDTSGGRAESGIAGVEVLARFTWSSGAATRNAAHAYRAGGTASARLSGTRVIDAVTYAGAAAAAASILYATRQSAERVEQGLGERSSPTPSE